VRRRVLPGRAGKIDWPGEPGQRMPERVRLTEKLGITGAEAKGTTMKVEWQESDIRVGRRFGKPGVRERQMIGYLLPEDGPKELVSISLCDGQVNPMANAEKMAAMLTEHGYVPDELLPPA
jgi:hypothetical protein